MTPEQRSAMEQAKAALELAARAHDAMNDASPNLYAETRWDIAEMAKAALPALTTALAADAAGTMKVDENGLLPCPFCGDHPDFSIGNNGTDKSSDHLISCQNEKCAAQPNMLIVVEDNEPPDAAIKIWNTRALSAQPAADMQGGAKDALIERLKNEAIFHAGEARAANATLNEIYQAVSQATGEKANWNGARPVVEELNRLRGDMQRVRDAALEEAAKYFQKKLDDYCEEHFHTDFETGAREAGNRAKEDYANNLEEIIEQIRALIATPQAAGVVRATWGRIAGEGAKLKREQLYREIGKVTEKGLRSDLEHTFSKLFMFLEEDLSKAMLPAPPQPGAGEKDGAG